MKSYSYVIKLMVVSLGLALTFAPSLWADTFSSVANGAYNANATWGGSSNPANGTADTVTLNNTVNLTTASWADLDTITFGSGGSGILNLSNNNSLTFSISALDFSQANSTISLSRATSGSTANHKLNASIVTLGNGKTLTVGNGTSITGGAAGTLVISGSGTLTGTQTFNVGTAASAVNIVTMGGAIANGTSAGYIVKAGGGTLVLAGVNTYTGDTTVNAGTFALADNAGMKFAIGANGVNNKIDGSGTVTLDGDFTFDLTGAGTTVGNSWLIVDVPNLSATFTDNFTVVGFDPNGTSLWDYTSLGGVNYQFSEITGRLTVIVPEPDTLAMILCGAALLFVMQRRRLAMRC